jgi:DNA repair photolyase
LFPLEWIPPTSREVAASVRGLGRPGLPTPDIRANQTTYQEIRCRSALNRVKGMPFDWALNPYRGCTHACHYCFARKYQGHLELGTGDDFSSVIFVKTNLVEVLRRELARPSWAREQVAVGTATDPYQPVEGEYALTRGALEQFVAARTPIGLVTKGPMVVRDIDVLQSLSAVARCTIYVSVPSVHEEAWQKLEPGTAHPAKRLRAVRRLVDAGIRTCVLMAPLLPGITTSRSAIEATVRAAAEHGASVVGANVVRLDAGTREHFLGVLAREFPHLSDGYGRLFASGSRVPRSYASAVESIVRAAMDMAHAGRSEARGSAGPATTRAGRRVSDRAEPRDSIP